MKRCILLWALLGMSAAAHSSSPSSPGAATVTVSTPWMRATVPQAKSSGAFMRLRAASDARLVDIRSDVAGLAEVHRMEMVGQIMKMRAEDGLALPAGKTVDLTGPRHIMLMDLKRQLKPGQVVALTLVIEKPDRTRYAVLVEVPVMPLSYAPPPAP
ncbi:MAG: copper chaperone PCu(A)C [Pseudomonadota bacterium]